MGGMNSSGIRVSNRTLDVRTGPDMMVSEMITVTRTLRSMSGAGSTQGTGGHHAAPSERSGPH